MLLWVNSTIKCIVRKHIIFAKKYAKKMNKNLIVLTFSLTVIFPCSKTFITVAKLAAIR